MFSYILNVLLEPWHRRQRRYDALYLWPAMLREVVDLEHARAAFAYHASIDSAWKHLSAEKTLREMDELPTGILS